MAQLSSAAWEALVPAGGPPGTAAPHSSASAEDPRPSAAEPLPGAAAALPPVPESGAAAPGTQEEVAGLPAAPAAPDTGDTEAAPQDDPSEERIARDFRRYTREAFIAWYGDVRGPEMWDEAAHRVSCTCLACLETQVVRVDQGAWGLTCPNGHYICTEDVGQHVEAFLERLDEDTALLEQHRERGGLFKCISPGCQHLFQDSDLQKVLSTALFGLYRAARDAVSEHRDWVEARAHMAEHQVAAHEEALSAAFLRLQYPTARMCPQCSCGPVININCDDLMAHHGQAMMRVSPRSDGVVDLVAGTVVINNGCPQCGFFTWDWNAWNRWDGVLRAGAPAHA